MIAAFELEAVEPDDIFSANLQDVLHLASLAAAPEWQEPQCYYVNEPAIKDGELIFFPGKQRGWLYAEGMSYDLRGETAKEIVTRWQAEREKP